MLEFLNKYKKDYIYSQNGEEGIIQECLKRMNITMGHCVEIGANDGKWCSNTALLIDNGWSAKMVEADFKLWQKCCETWKDNPKVSSQCSMVDAYNVNAFVKEDCVVLSIDTDGHDYYIFRALKEKPPIIIVEIDSSIAPYSEEKFNSEGGASYSVMTELAIEKGYFLLCHTGNLVLVDNKYKGLFSEITADPLIEHDLYFNKSWLKAA